MSIVNKSRPSWLHWFAVWLLPLRMKFIAVIGLPVVAIVLFSLIAYGIAYDWNIGRWIWREIDPVTMTIITHTEPEVFSLYGAFGLEIELPPQHDNLRMSLLRVFFKPAYQVDRWWRPSRWATTSKSWDAATAKERADALSDLTDSQFYNIEKFTGRGLREEAGY